MNAPSADRDSADRASIDPAAFNLLDEPWIRVRLLDGQSDTVSLREVFHRSTEIRRIAGELPTQDFAILRLILAVMYRSVPADDELEEIWKSGTLPLDDIDDYLDQWHDRFDLFDSTHPFMQVANLQSTSGETRPLTLLVPDAPGPGSLFTMRRDVPDLSYAEAARWLVHCQAYDFDGIKSGAVGDPRTKGGKGYPVGIGWAGWLGGLYLEGDDLRETLLHNWVPKPDTAEDDYALWEFEPLTPAPRKVSSIGPYGPAGLFTWPIRHIRLFTSGDRVTRVLICVGDPIAKAYQLGIEPMTSWRYSEPQTKKEKSPSPLYMPRAHDFSRALWRGLAALLPPPQPRINKKGIVESRPSEVVDRLGTRVVSGELPNDRVSLVSVGVEYGSNMSVYSEIFTDRLVVYPAIAQGDSAAYRCVIEAIERSDDGVSALARLASDLAVADGGDRSGAASRARTTAYAALDQHFRAWVSRVGGDRDTEELLQVWFARAHSVLRDLGAALLDSATPRSRAVQMVDGRAVSAGAAADWFHYNLRRHLPVERKDEKQ